MSDTRVLLNRIAAVRERVGLAQAMLEETDPAKAASIKRSLGKKLKKSGKAQQLLGDSIRELADEPIVGGAFQFRPLTHRVRRALERCQVLVGQLRALNLDPDQSAAYRRCIAMTESAVRLAQGMPDGASDQVRVCEGLEGLLDSIDELIARLQEAVARHRQSEDWIAQLSHAIGVLSQGDILAMDLFLDIGTELLRGAYAGEPLRVLSSGKVSLADSNEAGQSWQFRHIATHALNTAQVAARLAPHINEFEDKALIVIVAALLHDVGFATMPFSLLAQPTRLSPEQLRVIESHPTRGAEIVARQIPKCGPLAECIRQHHERLDGTGYPDGTSSMVPLARIVAACDVYAAFLAPRPHRGALDPRQAMTQMLLASRRGRFDPQVTDAMKRLGYYPSGSVVELHNGRIGLVVAPEMVALLTDTGGACLSSPCYIDLSADDDGVIRRCLTAEDRVNRLGTHYPQLV